MRLGHAGDVEELIERGKVSFALPQLDDSLRDRASDSGNGRKLAGVRGVNVDAARSGHGPSMPPAVTLASAHVARFAGRWNVYLIAILGSLCEIDAAVFGARGKAAGQGDGLRVALTAAEMVKARTFHRSRDIHDDILVAGQ